MATLAKRALDEESGAGPSGSGPSGAVGPSGSVSSAGSGPSSSNPPKRVRASLAGLAPPAAPVAAAQPMEIQVIQYRGLKSKQAKLEADGFKVINVTSKGDAKWKKLSPFYPHRSIPVPGSRGTHSASVEGLWQGLKVFERAGVDEAKFTNVTERGLKRLAKTLGPVRHHWWGPLPSEGASAPEQQLDYVEARRRLYVPSYTFVLENKVQSLVRDLAKMAGSSKIALVDYYTNDNVGDIKTPLSHASLLRKYIIDNFQSLVAA